jgi:hypothetical protein
LECNTWPKRQPKPNSQFDDAPPSLGPLNCELRPSRRSHQPSVWFLASKGYVVAVGFDPFDALRAVEPIYQTLVVPQVEDDEEHVDQSLQRGHYAVHAEQNWM